jgi:hypothetical protein
MLQHKPTRLHPTQVPELAAEVNEQGVFQDFFTAVGGLECGKRGQWKTGSVCNYLTKALPAFKTAHEKIGTDDMKARS